MANRIVFIDCALEYRILRERFEQEGIACSSFSQEAFEKIELDALADAIEGEGEASVTAALYASHAMDFKLEGFLRRIQKRALLVPSAARRRFWA